MFYDFIYLAKGFQMRQKVRSTLINQSMYRVSITRQKWVPSFRQVTAYRAIHIT